MKLFSIARRLSTAASTAAVKPPSISMSLHKLKKVSDPDEALRLYNTFIAGASAPSARFAQLHTVRLLANSGRFTDIETFLESQKSSSHTTQEYFLYGLIQSYGVAGMFQNALRTYEQMSELGTPRSALSFNALLLACVKCKMFDRAVTYFDEFPAKFGFSPDKYSYGMLIRAYCEMGSFETAIEKLNEMRDKGFEIGAIVFASIYQSLSVNKRIKEAESFWDEMINEKRVVKLDAFCYNVKFGNTEPEDTDGFKRLIQEMDNAGVVYNGITSNIVIQFYCENGMINEANKVYEQMLAQRGRNWAPAAFSTLVFHNYEIGQVKFACRVFKESLYYNKTLDFDMLKLLAGGLAKTGHEKEAKDLIFRSMKKRFPPNSLEVCGQLADALGLVLDGNEDLDLEKTDNGVDSWETAKPSESPVTMAAVKPPTSSQAMRNVINVFSSKKQKVPYLSNRKTKASLHNMYSASLSNY